MVYGGLIASLFDCHCIGTAVAAAYEDEGRQPGTEPLIMFVTANLNVNYLRPTPMGSELLLNAHIVERKGKKNRRCLHPFGRRYPMCRGHGRRYPGELTLIGKERPIGFSSVEHLFIITGTTRGIGRALADRALALGDSFVVGFSRADALLEGNHQHVHVDLNAIETIGAAFDAIDFNSEKACGLKQTVLINNGRCAWPHRPHRRLRPEALAGNIRVNLTAPMVLAHHFYRFSNSFPEKNGSSNITSGASRSPYFGWSAYGAARPVWIWPPGPWPSSSPGSIRRSMSVPLHREPWIPTCRPKFESARRSSSSAWINLSI